MVCWSKDRGSTRPWKRYQGSRFIDGTDEAQEPGQKTHTAQNEQCAKGRNVRPPFPASQPNNRPVDVRRQRDACAEQKNESFRRKIAHELATDLSHLPPLDVAAH